MKIASIIAEYNPFHNGHGYHLEETRARTGCDAVVAVMSGHFVQRGEPAAFDKWARTRMALACGVDAVFELPAFYALQSADWFAWGGVAVLHGLGADCLSFGSEVTDLAALTHLSAFWDSEPEDLRAAIQAELKAGKSHPRARADALSAVAGEGVAAAQYTPNSVLGAMYLRQIGALGGGMEPVVVRRAGAGYNDGEINGPIASATAVRRALFEGGGWRAAVPGAAAEEIDREIQNNAGPLSADDFGQMLLYALRTGRALPDAAEGLDNRMRRAAEACGSAEAYFAAVKSKRYTMARIKRAAMQALLGISGDDIAFLRGEKPVYARLLGYSRRVGGLAGELARRATIPFVARPPEYRPRSAAESRLWQIDRTASDIYALAQRNPALRRGGRDMTEKLIVL